ncbi:glycerol-3-phosphate acyltransferase [Deinococcus maricopensis]|uniref:Glycerol-3-phosphate acyltransferase n=1 Tax=Deinococcus maricopensis (strain DSM 21211 / LMG 22137 / NRRL B-23946 / LB-34) TaxID=709986 RepID=E8UB25_DEIML|nr:glycerol-3-phosphate acyltransferase [Deinococcus maricopensis]ADV68264.1 Glycerol-3-phosphate acyltransferase [Deinococcus maricopensis DSM 21211]
MLFLSVLLVALGFAVGALPLGYWLLSNLGVNVRLVSAHNLGVENVLRRAGTGPAVASAALDASKGFLAVLMASSLGSVSVCVLAGVAAYVGHLFPPRALVGSTPPRGRGNLVLLGVLTGLSVAGGVSAWLTLPALIVWAGVLGFTGFVSVATLSGVAVLAVLLSLSGTPDAVKFGAWALLAVSTWRFKENIGRVLDGTEPRVGEDVPMAGKRDDVVVAAFMIHPMTLKDFWQTKRFSWMRPLVERGVITEGTVRRLAAELRPMKVGELRGIRTAGGKEVRCYLLSSPLLPDVFRDQPELATRRAIEGAQLARELGASVFGLGAFWSVVGNKGEAVQAAVPEITITNGGAYTSGTIKAAIPGILEHFQAEGRDLREATAAVVGANGVVAFGIARTIAPQVRRVIMVGRDLERLERSANTLRRAAKDTEIITTVNVADIRDADLVFTATSDPNPVIFAQHVKPGAWLFDEGRPADVDEGVTQVPGVRVIPGGVVRPPGNMQTRVDLQFGEGQVPACLAETLIIAATGEYDRKSLGAQTKTENINFFVEEAERLGFQVVD